MHNPTHNPDDLERHNSKILVVTDPEADTVTLTLVCDRCGRVELANIPTVHLCTFKSVIIQVIERLGLDESLVEQQMSSKGSFLSEQAAKEEQKRFDDTSVAETFKELDLTPTPTSSAWD